MGVTYFLLGLMFFATAYASPAFAEVYRPWCAQYMNSTGDGTTNCSFTSYEQCMMTARGAGAYCVQNPWYLQYGSGQSGYDSTGRGERPRRRY
jgi:hypothetical protein